MKISGPVNELCSQVVINLKLATNLQIAIYNLHYTLYFAGLNKIVKVRKSSINQVPLTISIDKGTSWRAFRCSSWYFSGCINWMQL